MSRSKLAVREQTLEILNAIGYGHDTVDEGDQFRCDGTQARHSEHRRLWPVTGVTGLAYI